MLQHKDYPHRAGLLCQALWIASASDHVEAQIIAPKGISILSSIPCCCCMLGTASRSAMEDSCDHQRQKQFARLWRLWKISQLAPQWSLWAAVVPGGPDSSQFELKRFLCKCPVASKPIGGSWKVEALEGGKGGERQPANKCKTTWSAIPVSKQVTGWNMPITRK